MCCLNCQKSHWRFYLGYEKCSCQPLGMMSKKKHLNQSLVGLPISSIVLDLFIYRFPFWKMLYLKAVVLNFDHKMPLLEKKNKTAQANGELTVYSRNPEIFLGFSYFFAFAVTLTLVKIKRPMSLNKPASSESAELIWSVTSWSKPLKLVLLAYLKICINS